MRRKPTAWTNVDDPIDLSGSCFDSHAKYMTAFRVFKAFLDSPESNLKTRTIVV
jgi:hypothetical protein